MLNPNKPLSPVYNAEENSYTWEVIAMDEGELN
jgi:hypothetical protein